MTGVSSDLLAPDAVFTWAQAVQSTYALEGCPTLSSSVKFADAAPADWFASAVNCAAANGVVSEWMMPIWLSTARSFVRSWPCAAPITRGMILVQHGSIQLHHALPSSQWTDTKALINGTSITFLTPASSTTSVQMPVILMRFCEGIAG